MGYNEGHRQGELLQYVTVLGFFSIFEVHTDSQYVQKGISEWMRGWITRNWKTSAGKPVKNKDLWLQLNNLNDKLTVHWKWVKGHAGDEWNERCDELVARERSLFI